MWKSCEPELKHPPKGWCCSRYVLYSSLIVYCTNKTRDFFPYYLGYLLFQKHLDNGFSTLVSLVPQWTYLSLSPGWFSSILLLKQNWLGKFYFISVKKNVTTDESRARPWQTLSVFAHWRRSKASLCVNRKSWRNSPAYPLKGGCLLATGRTVLRCANVTAQRRGFSTAAGAVSDKAIPAA